MIPEEVIFIIDKLNTFGYEAYAVGGCVRDMLLGKEPNDWDITSSARPEATAEIFSDFKQVHSGMKHGTVGVIINGTMFEITTFRVDGAYRDMRRPDSVSFTSSLVDDLSRRDFTVNAMAMDKNGNIVDEFSSEADLKSKIIRCVGEPEKRFNEDALRIMRALRFAALDGFSIEKKTLDTANALASNLTHIAYERIWAELKKMLSSKNASGIMRKTLPVFSVIFPTLNANEYKWQRICTDVKNCAGDMELSLFCILVHSSIEDELARLRVDSALKKKLLRLKEMKALRLENNKISFKKKMVEYGVEAVMLLCRYKVITKKVDAGFLETAQAASDEFVALNELKLTGQDIFALGFRSYKIKLAQNMLHEAVINEKCKNEYDSLKEYLLNNTK